MNGRLVAGINIGIFLVLTIVVALLFFPLKLQLDTSYDVEDRRCDGNKMSHVTVFAPRDIRRLRICPKYEYEFFVKSTFLDSYDRNCTYSRTESRQIESNDGSLGILNESGKVHAAESSREETEGSRGRKKSGTIASHILAVMLVVSVAVALIEVLRIRFLRDKDSTNGSARPRRVSPVDLVQRRRVQRESVQTQRSFEMMGMHRSALRLLGARPPPLVRRSSFPTQRARKTLVVVGDTPASRRPSVDSDDEVGALHRRSRLIRRH